MTTNYEWCTAISCTDRAHFHKTVIITHCQDSALSAVASAKDQSANVPHIVANCQQLQWNNKPSCDKVHCLATIHTLQTDGHNIVPQAWPLVRSANETHLWIWCHNNGFFYCRLFYDICVTRLTDRYQLLIHCDTQYHQTFHHTAQLLQSWQTAKNSQPARMVTYGED